MPYEPFKTHKSDEYFISIVQQGLHTFLMLGVMQENKPRLLARIGKQRYGFAPISQLKEIYSFFFGKVNTDLISEGVYRKKVQIDTLKRLSSTPTRVDKEAVIKLNLVLLIKTNGQYQIGFRDYNHKYAQIPIEDNALKQQLDANPHVDELVKILNPLLTTKNINYSAYAITYEQMLECTKLFDQLLNTQSIKRAEYEDSQCNEDEHKEIKRTREWRKKWYQNNAAFYKPLADPSNIEEDSASFAYTPINITTPDSFFADNPTYKQTQFFNQNNTCRHTAIELLNQTRQAETPRHVSSSFFRALPVPTQLVEGVPSQTLPFYILPLPPTAFDVYQKSPSLAFTLTKLYKRMEDLITLDPHAEITKTKFDKLKTLYNKLAKESNLSPNDLLNSIHTWRSSKENEPVFKLRRTYFFDYFVKRKTSTEKEFDNIEQFLIHHTSNKAIVI